ncbi:ShlB/FhaC/HecB family hemolysin secretion/activation protein [Sphingomonas sp. A2-49]|uniref:ShlB/FhaC/HecB family hemolysin secretion/activation protein n=1 Tax=Sphingomonas sp. A2-49 TaxID=1391375 RepID=UPI0021D068C1|nr:ShlB/FhaC/HecB family hemolysin secretion/activation protein [Sphingomonas sp. A2-49]MCU6456102.1 ShlB/FhaC/HecB family hemolysin secretion/activation protein [Sphingomonas sp. A2-49]
MRRELILTTLGAACAYGVPMASAQVRLDRADPTITEQALPRPAPVSSDTNMHGVRVAPVAEGAAAVPPSRIATAILVNGNVKVATGAFASTLVPYLGRTLGASDLSQLAGAVADVARRAGYPFASASIPPQPMKDGILHVSLDEGKIAAVRVIGIASPLADRILTQALVTDAPVRRGTLERAILLVSDIPGVTVKGTSYVRQNGFGILLVTATEDKASAYLQVDNRGSAEVGPIRATMLASLRGVAQAGDELRLIAAATPVEPSEFAFLRSVYAAPLDARGSMATVSASVGRANPGASLKPLDVVGNSVDVALGYVRPLLRSRRRSAWASVELRALKSDQALSGTMLRNDRIVTLTGTINGTGNVGPGVVRGEISMVGGLPVEGVSHEGDPRTSRSDGDARFVTWGYTIDWSAGVFGPFSVTVASSGQLASRPLLATAEIGAGGPAFGRAYDYAERTGDQGILGSVELRADLGRVDGGPDRVQLYGFVDGGYVDNLRDGPGGGSLLSTGTGAKLGYGVLDGMIEVAFPLNADRFDTNSKRPRVSFRVARTF